MSEFDLLLFDRITKIKSINEQYDLLNNGYISFSGGKDSVVLSHLVDLALPNNKIPRLFLNNELKQCEMIWKPVYDEYRRIDYRLKKNMQTKLV